jgi:hypothetical protein
MTIYKILTTDKIEIVSGVSEPEDHGLDTRGSSEPEDHGLVTRGSSEPEDHGLVTRSHLSSNNDLENILDILECNNNQS